MSANATRSGLDRRQFIRFAAGAALTAGAFAAGIATPAFAAEDPFPAPALPYDENALEPVISARTISFHYGKHTAAYYANLNKAVAGTDMAKMPLEDVVRKAAADPEKESLFNNAAQSWNHTFYWKNLAPGGQKMPGKVEDAIKAAFGSREAFEETFLKAATSQFGSGWAWLVEENGKLMVLKTPNAMNPLVMNLKPIMTVDVWEHAYYLDYQNKRADHVKAVLQKLVNWDVVAKNMA